MQDALQRDVDVYLEHYEPIPKRGAEGHFLQCQYFPFWSTALGAAS